MTEDLKVDWAGHPIVPVPVVPLWRQASRALAFVLIFATLCLLVVKVSAPHHRAVVAPTLCFEKFVNALKAESATGLWACFDQHMREDYFSNGWTGDADVQRALFAVDIAAKEHLEVKVYADNPVSVCIVNPATGGDMCHSAYLVHFDKVNADGTYVFQGSGTLAITLAGGLIHDISAG